VLGTFFAICSAATFAFNNASVRRGILSGSIIQGMAITVPIGVPLFFVLVLATGNLATVAGFSPAALSALAAAGIVHFVWGRYWNYRATRAMGSNLAGPLQQINLLVSLGAAIVWLGEYLTPLKIFGIGLILLGPTFTISARKPAPNERDVTEEKITPIDAEKPAGFEPKLGQGAVFSLLAATGQGLSPVLVRLGLEGHSGIGAGIAGGFIAYVAGTIVFGMLLLFPGQWRHVWSMDREAAKWFTSSGVFVTVSQMFLYMALALAPVTVVAPLNRLSILFRIYFSRLLNPQHEVFGGPVIVATVVSFAGAVALSLSTDVVQSLLPLSERTVAFLNWRWP
jgi:uncharacterized membrane protein